MTSREQPSKQRKFRRLVASASLLTLLAGILFLPKVCSGQAPDQVRKLVPLTVGNQWTYRVQIPKDVHLIIDPHFVYPDGLLRTSETNGVRESARGPEETAFKMKCVQAISDSSCKVEVDEVGLQLWFNLWSPEARLVLLPGDNFVRLELHDVTVIGKEKGDPWILGQMLALLPAKADQDRAEVSGWLVEPLKEAVRVPAGVFRKGFHSVIPMPGTQSVPAHTIESWTAEGVGLVKYIMKGPDDKVLFSLELVSYELK